MPPAPLLALLLVLTPPRQPTPAPKPEPFAILDNSFLVEEAFNQEAHIFQNIFGAVRQAGAWQMTFTQEWPAPSIRHQLSYTIGAQGAASASSVSDTLLNYRLQVLEEGPGRPAFAPRISAIVPSGSRRTGGGLAGLQVNLPFSKQHDDFYFHWNGGLTWLHRSDGDDLASPQLAGSAIYRLRPMLNLMLESVLVDLAVPAPDGRVEHGGVFTLSPGVRGGWNVAEDSQVILGAAVPITRAGGQTSTGIFGYFSYELRFGRH
jgi:hypothetical protein